MADLHNGTMLHVGNVDTNRVRTFLANARPYTGDPVLAGHLDVNSGLIQDVARLYIPDGANVLDMTLGKGAFWTATEIDRFNLYGMDIKEYTPEELEVYSEWGIRRVFQDNFKSTRFAPHQFDVVVFDPPYRSGGSTSHAGMVENYGLKHLDSDAKSKHGNRDIVWGLYEEGMFEAFRLLVPRGLMMVKCQDFVESGRQHWFHIEIYEMAKAMGMRVKDLFTLTQTRTPLMRHKSQRHSRRNVSFLWVFQKW